jgi:hypothetical protein
MQALDDPEGSVAAALNNPIEALSAKYYGPQQRAW